MAVKTATGAEEGNWRMYLFVIYMMMWRYFRKEYLLLQICWHISDKRQPFTFFTHYAKTYPPTEPESPYFLPQSQKTLISLIGPWKLPLGAWCSDDPN